MKQAVILIPGLGDKVRSLSFATHNWEKMYGVVPFVHPMRWMGSEESFETKLKRLIALIDNLCARGYDVSLLGTSAGGSCVINAFCERKRKIKRVINVCGRLKKGENVFPSLDWASQKSPSFRQSVLQCEENMKHLTHQDTKKIVTIRPLFDEVVPTVLVPIEGATNIRIIAVEHSISIILAMTLYSKIIIDSLLIPVGRFR